MDVDARQYNIVQGREKGGPGRTIDGAMIRSVRMREGSQPRQLMRSKVRDKAHR